jgi:hypothetical protein
MADEQIALLPEDYMHSLRAVVTNHEPDTIAVIVLSGTEEKGLALSVSSVKGHEETLHLLTHALAAEGGVEIVDD